MRRDHFGICFDSGSSPRSRIRCGEGARVLLSCVRQPGDSSPGRSQFVALRSCDLVYDDDGCEWLVKVEWAIVDDDGYADYRRFFIDDGFAPDLFTEDGLQNILLSKRKRFDAFLRDNQPYAPKCSRIKGNPRDWYICPKTHDWHNNQCRECQNNLINEFRTGTDYRQGGLFFYCAYPRIIHEADKYGEVHLPSIRF